MNGPGFSSHYSWQILTKSVLLLRSIDWATDALANTEIEKKIIKLDGP